jgi:prephenate dehydrogenase
MNPQPIHSNHWHVGLIGYGEVGRILAEDLRKDGVRVSTYDIKLGGAQAAPLREHGEKSSVSSSTAVGAAKRYARSPKLCAKSD